MQKIIIAISFFYLFLICACNNHSNPKPREYFRIDYPEKSYQTYISDAPYMFEYPKYTIISKDSDSNTEPYWININFPDFKANIHVSYKQINENLEELLEDSRTLVYKHVVKADAIEEVKINNDSCNVYGIIYKIKGNAASPAQFYLTDSINHFLRGSLYFNVHPNKDSLAPVVDFLITDIDTIVNTFRWK
jgi:gliding motility-associated lipoprotein GldD